MGLSNSPLKKGEAASKRLQGDVLSDSPLIKGASGLSQGVASRSKTLPNGFRVELVTWLRDSSLLAECFRAVLTSILFTGVNGHRPKVIVLASSSPAEGKTTVASNLAIALAEISRRVLLIDGDLRRPRLHQLFDVDNDYGLSDLLRERQPVEGYPMTTLVHETGIPGLYLLASGKASHSVANLLHSTRLREWLACFRQKFDAVLIDTPPMLQLPDARVLGRLADGVVLVVRAGQTSRDMAKAACQRFEEDGTRILGTVLNDWDPSKGEGYGYGYGYGHYTRSYYHHQGKKVKA
jgi:succinoglycan biosynthesis transport protein ExoP